MIQLGVLNSRMKDFFNIWLLSRQFDFNSADLVEAFGLIFERRKNSIPTKTEPFSESFINEELVNGQRS